MESQPKQPGIAASAPAGPVGTREASRLWRQNRYIYPVLARRTGGVSIGVNLNVDKICNFGCIYCEVNRGVVPLIRDVDLEALTSELRAALAMAQNGELLRDARFAGLAAPDGGALRVTDIAFSGDGEPTSFRNFKAVVERTIALRDEAGARERPTGATAVVPDVAEPGEAKRSEPEATLKNVKIVVITNASLFHRPQVREALHQVNDAGGEVWAKLDAGTAAYFKLIDDTTIPYERILRNIRDLGREMPLVIQTCFMQVHGAGPGDEEIAAYIGRLRSFLEDGAQIKLVQVYSVSRPPAESYVTMLPPSELERVRSQIEAALGGIPVRRFDGSWTGAA
jgi:wyosine [tRNA(Phe)-imidazoG37] synthetase (radical SAM superfamily)